MDRGVLLCQCTERDRLARIEAEQVRQGAQIDLLVRLTKVATRRTVREQVPGVTALVAAIAALIRTFGAP